MNIKDIAAAANVSVSTVSKVLNHKDHDISEATKKRVLSVIKENNYSPYSNLKDVSPFKAFIVALMIDPSLISEVFISPLEKHLAKNGYGLMLCPMPEDGTSIKRQLNILHTKHIDGIIFFSYSEKLAELFTENNKYNIPSVCLYPGPFADYSTLCCNPADLSRTAVQLLIQKGHTRIGCLIEPDTMSAELIKRGYLEALFQHSLPQDNSLIIDCNPALYDSLSTLIDNDVTALYCQNSQLTSAVCAFLSRKNISVPENISIITSGTYFSSTEMFYPVCCVDFAWDEVCASTVNILIPQIEGKTPRVTSAKVHPHIWRQDHICAPSSNIVRIMVAGNITMDTIITTEHLPEAGDLLTADNIITAPGGKGVNQAIASANLGGDVTILGRVGDDIEGHAIIDTFLEHSIKASGAYIDSMCSTGKTFINSTHGEHSSVVAYPGANLNFDIKQVKENIHIFQNIDMCLISTEIPPEVITFIINKCYELNIKIFLKPSVNTKIKHSLLKKIDYLIPNRQELDQLVPGNKTIFEKAEELFRICNGTIIVTLGEDGCYVKNQTLNYFFPAADFTPVDTTGAANCFIGALAVSLGKGNTLPYSICYATYAAGFSVAQAGIQTSFPTKSQLIVYKDEIHSMYVDFLKNSTSDSSSIDK